MRGDKAHQRERLLYRNATGKQEDRRAPSGERGRREGATWSRRAALKMRKRGNNAVDLLRDFGICSAKRVHVCVAHVDSALYCMYCSSSQRGGFEDSVGGN